jgi:hypothetical protein
MDLPIAQFFFKAVIMHALLDYHGKDSEDPHCFAIVLGDFNIDVALIDDVNWTACIPAYTRTQIWLGRRCSTHNIVVLRYEDE